MSSSRAWCWPGARPSPGCCNSSGSIWWRRSWATACACPGRRIDAEIRQVVKLMVPGLVSGGLAQISIMIATILARLQDQAVSYLSYADRLYQLPLALIGAAIGVVLLPVLSRAIRGGREAEAMAAFNRSLEFAASADPARDRRLDRRGRADRARALRARQLHAGRDAQHRARPDGDLHRPAGLRAEQGVAARLLRAPGHGDAVQILRRHHHPSTSSSACRCSGGSALGDRLRRHRARHRLAAWINCTLLYRSCAGAATWCWMID